MEQVFSTESSKQSLTVSTQEEELDCVGSPAGATNLYSWKKHGDSICHYCLLTVQTFLVWFQIVHYTLCAFEASFHKESIFWNSIIQIFLLLCLTLSQKWSVACIYGSCCMKNIYEPFTTSELHTVRQEVNTMTGTDWRNNRFIFSFSSNHPLVQSLLCLGLKNLTESKKNTSQGIKIYINKLI